MRVLLAPPPADLTHPISLPQVQQVLVWLKRMFPWVIVDLGLPLDETAFAFLDGADRIVMSVLPEMVGLRNTRLMLDQLHAARLSRREGLAGAEPGHHARRRAGARHRGAAAGARPATRSRTTSRWRRTASTAACRW